MSDQKIKKVLLPVVFISVFFGVLIWNSNDRNVVSEVVLNEGAMQNDSVSLDMELTESPELTVNRGEVIAVDTLISQSKTTAEPINIGPDLDQYYIDLNDSSRQFEYIGEYIEVDYVAQRTGDFVGVNIGKVRTPESSFDNGQLDQTPVNIGVELSVEDFMREQGLKD